MAIWEADEGCEGCCIGDVNWDGVVDPNDAEIIQDEIDAECVGYRPIPLFVWDEACYDPNSACDPNCQDSKGCLPMALESGSAAGVHDINATAGQTRSRGRRSQARHGGACI
ncbi:MAG TPA: hypothetical protein PKC49_12510 [Phycisphaerae bacterium]|nr:hypothetical protein [Phycisphaerae bacterium]